MSAPQKPYLLKLPRPLKLLVEKVAVITGQSQGGIILDCLAVGLDVATPQAKQRRLAAKKAAHSPDNPQKSVSGLIRKKGFHRGGSIAGN